MRLSPLIPLLISLATASAEKPARTCRILFPDAPAQAPRTLHLFDGETFREVELPRMNFSPVHEIRPGALTLTMLPAPPAPETGGTALVIPPGAPAAFIPQSIGDFYLIVSSDPENTVSPVRIQVINADTTRFKRGQMLWLNLTESRIGGILGSRKLLLEPHSHLILDAAATGLESYHVNIHHLPPGGQRAEPLCETRWTHDPRSRSVFFVLPPSGSLTPRIIGIPDFRPQEKTGDRKNP